MMHVVHLEDDGLLQNLLKIALCSAQPDIKLKQFIDSDEAVTYIAENIDTIDLFILDIRVAGSMNGVDVAHKIRELNSNAPIIVTSAFQKPAAHILTTLNCRWYAKPWHIADITRDMLQTLRQASPRQTVTKDSMEIKLLMPGLARRYINQQGIVVFSLTEYSPAHVDGFFDALHEVQAGWEAGKPFLGLYDFSRNLDIYMTAQFRTRALQLAQAHRQLVGRSAYVLPAIASYIVRPMWTFIKSELAPINPQHDMAAFHSGDTAQEWLKAGYYVPG